MRTYFPGLDALRAYAALSVLVFHCVEKRNRLFPQAPIEAPPFFLSGSDAVSLFFVLSGFLITYLLLEEKEAPEGIRLGRFYRRRIARIFPLYFLTLALALWVLPSLAADYPKPRLGPGETAMMLTFLSNVAFAIGAATATASHLWSIGVEEQFYLVWPVLLRRVRQPLIAIVGMTALPVAAMAVILVLIGREGMSPTLQSLFRWAYFTRFQCMALGALAALLFRRKHPAGEALLHPAALILGIALGICAIAFWKPPTAPPDKPHALALTLADLFLRDLVLAVSFTILIAQVAAGRARRALELRPLRLLGRISYGLYMIHPLVIGILAPLLVRPSSDAALFVLAVTAVTIGLSAASYALIESPLLRRAGSSRRLVDSRLAQSPGAAAAPPP